LRQLLATAAAAAASLTSTISTKISLLLLLPYPTMKEKLMLLLLLELHFALPPSLPSFLAGMCLWRGLLAVAEVVVEVLLLVVEVIPVRLEAGVCVCGGGCCCYS